jgi:deazaflavin-dependent oxidoreductase (nitroreductase family)
MPLIDFSHKPTGWLKWLLKTPCYVFRARLGFLFFHRFVMIEHRGRSGHTLYRTVIEMAARRRNEWVCASGTGPQADWYLNLRAGGLEAIWVGSKRCRATVRFLNDTEAADVMREYEKARPRTASRLFSIMGVTYDGTDAGRVEMMTRVPMVAFSPITRPSHFRATPSGDDSR